MKKLQFFFLLLSLQAMQAQQTFTRKDSLHGGLRFERTCFDVQRYDIDIKIDTEKRTIEGVNTIGFRVVDATKRIQLDLFANMLIDSIVMDGKKLTYTREYNAVFVDFANQLQKDENRDLHFYYSGTPLAAKNAPWDGGFDWSKDKSGKPWVGVAVQGIGASLWIPVKDSQTDEPDFGTSIKVAVPNGLMNVSNGRFKGGTDLGNGYTRWDWEVQNPINSYDITINIGDYSHIHDSHNGLDLDYYVLRGNEEKATKHFAEVKPMMDCFQQKFGIYPFASDGYKLVETHYLGMEHQSAVANGNNYQMGYHGSDLSGTGIGLLFDFLTIHESAHEWFGNSITAADIADMWIHEGFTTYAEAVYVECEFGYQKSQKYINGIRRNIRNDKPIIGSYGVQNEGSGDMYFKGALMLNTIRSILGDDAKWWKILYDFSTVFRHKITDTPTVIGFFNSESGLDLTPVFDQYLRTVKIPLLTLHVDGKFLVYKWENTVAGFTMPVDIEIGGKARRIVPSSEKTNRLKTGKIQLSDIKVRTDRFLIDYK